MKRGVAVLALGLVALGIQGGLALSIPRVFCPDLGLLWVLAIGLHWNETTSGLFIASALGFAADILSSSIFGAHALLRVFAYAATSLTRRQMDLRGGVALPLFVAALTFFYALGLFVLMRFFGGATGDFGWPGLGGLFPHAAVNAVFAPVVSTVMVRVCEWAQGESSRGGLEIDAKRSTP